MGKWIFLSLFLFAFSDARATRGPIIRVRIGKALSTLIFSGQDLIAASPVIMGLQNKPGHRVLQFNCRGHELTKKSGDAPTLLASLSSSSGVVTWEKAPYLGNLDLLVSGQGDACDLVNSLPLDSYISSLLAKEMNAGWPIQALKAQAIAARTYALFQMDGNEAGKNPDKLFFDLENSEKYQVNGSLMDTTSNTWKAAMETSGEILSTVSGKIVPIFFHAQCGGRTFVPGQIWGNSVEGYRNVVCPFCQGMGKDKGQWKKEIFSAEFMSALWKLRRQGKAILSQGTMFGTGSAPHIFPHQRLDPTIKIYLQDQVYEFKKSDLRNVLGRNILPSHFFKIDQVGTKYVIEGMGDGHGVGMCQLGALTMARQGKSYREILHTYFPDLKLQKIY